MKFLVAILLFLLPVTTLFSQEFLKHSTIHFKDSSTASGDFYYYPTIDQSVTLLDSLGKKQVYDLALIDYIEGKTDRYRVLDFNGTPKLFESVIEGNKMSLYKTSFNQDIQFYVLKQDTVYWLEGGRIEFMKDDKRYRTENTRYKGILKILMVDNSYVINKIDKIKYLENEITPIVIAYNEGRVSFVKTKAMEKQNKIPDWKIFAQYSHGRNTPIYIYDGNFSSQFFSAGAEYFNTEGSRHSFKFGIEYGQFDLNKRSDKQWINLNSAYYYDFVRTPRENLYFGVRLMDITYDWGSDDTNFYLYPRFSPLMGYERHLTNKTDLYFELNHLLSMSKIFLNFSVGFTYDL